MAEKAEPNNSMRTLVILLYELGAVAHDLIYAKNAPDDRARIANMTNAKANMADVLTQLRLLAEQLGINFDELWKEGEERFIERHEELKKGEI